MKNVVLLHSLLARVRVSSLPLAALALSLAACGGGDARPPVAPEPPAPPAAPAAPAASTPEVAPPAAAPAAAIPPAAPAGGNEIIATTKTDAAWASCHQRYQGAGRDFVKKGKDVAKEVAAMAEGCKTVTKMSPMGKTLTGEGAEKGKSQSFPLEAKANHCYRAYAMASESIKDLDVVLKDSVGHTVGQDSTDDPSPVVNEDGAVCFNRDDKAAVVVTIDAGKGAFALQIWSD